MQISELVDKIKKFNEKRGWDDEIEVSDTAKSIIIEAAEILQHYQWDKKRKDKLGRNKKFKSGVQDEIADVFIYLARLSYLLNLDLEKLVLKKMRKNSKRYPAK